MQEKFGDSGYAYWFKTLELIASQGKDGVLEIPMTQFRHVVESGRTDRVLALNTLATRRGRLLIVENSDGILRIECPKFREYSDNYTKYSGLSSKRLQRVYKLSESRREEEEKKKRREEKESGAGKGVPARSRPGFDIIWEKYPNKQGRKQAERHFNATVKNAQHWQAINVALGNYLRSANVREGFIKQGSTWFNDWEAWVKPTAAMMGRPNGQGVAAHETRSGPETDRCDICGFRGTPAQVLSHDCRPKNR